MSRSGVDILGGGEYGWFLLENIENSLMEFADVIQLQDDPDHNHLGVFSRRIALKLYEVGTVAEGLFKEIVKEPLLNKLECIDLKNLEKARRKENPYPDIRDFKDVLEPVLSLSRRSVTFRYFTFVKTVKPFSTFAASNGVSPAWWISYNEVKHDLLGNIEKATLGTLIEGASAVFLLTVLCSSYWPTLTLNNRIIMGPRIGHTHRAAVSGNIVYEQLHEAIMNIQISPHPIRILDDILAYSRLFFSPLAVFNSKLDKYEIPP